MAQTKEFRVLNPAAKQTVSGGNLDTMGSESIFKWKLVMKM
jgi:hypothetical protein